MYVILVNEDNTLTTTCRQRIMQKSKLVDDLYFFVKPIYNGHDMTEFTVMLEYTLPVTQEGHSDILELSPERYKNYLQYKLPVDSVFTKEAGDIEIRLSFLSSAQDAPRIRKSDITTITIYPCGDVDGDTVTEEKLDAIDQRILMMDAQIKELREIGEMLDKNKADNLKYDDKTNEIQLLSGGVPIGNAVELETAQVDIENIVEVIEETIADGVPVVDFSEND